MKMTMIKLVAAIVIAFVIIAEIAIVVIYLSRVITCGMDEIKERKRRNGKR